MQKKFINLIKTDNNPIWINTLLITSIEQYEDSTAIHTMDTKTIQVKETPEQVIKEIQKAEQLTFINT